MFAEMWVRVGVFCPIASVADTAIAITWEDEQFNLVVSDLAPNVTGIKSVDQAAMMVGGRGNKEGAEVG